MCGQLGAQNWCGTDDHQQEMWDKYPNRRAEVSRLMQGISSQKSSIIDYEYIIPVVVHVVHDSGVGNIDYDQVVDGIRMLNEDFRRYNDDSSDTRDIFRNVIGRAPIQFRLAQIDPQGNPTDGVNRINSAQYSWNANTETRTSSSWASDMYFNIWVVISIENTSGLGTILGRAYFPWWGINDEFGFLIKNTAYGRIGTGSPGRTITHEVGHCFGLFHTFQSGCGDSCLVTGDMVCDTPPTDNPTYGCSMGQNQCDNDTLGSPFFFEDVPDQIENYMSYDNCQNMFSAGQVDRMVNSILDYPRLFNLTTYPNHLATGVIDLSSVDFKPSHRFLCVGETTTYYDYSTHGQYNWDWSFEGGSPATTGTEFPVISYSQPGSYDAQLSVADLTQTRTEFKANYVFVSDKKGKEIPYFEDFEEDLVTDFRWYIDSYESNIDWVQTNSLGFSGSRCLTVDNFTNSSDGVKAYIISETLDLSNMDEVSISFRVAYAQKDVSNNDRLKLELSYNCGTTWSSMWLKLGSSMKSVDPQTTAFTPTLSDWRLFTVSGVPDYIMREGVRLKFIFESDLGNNLYLDDINVFGATQADPFLELPEDGAFIYDSTSIYFDWKAVFDVDYYLFQLDTSILFNSSYMIENTLTYFTQSSANFDTELNVNNLARKTHYWRVKTITNDTVLGPWSDVFSFTITTITATVIPVSGPMDLLKVYPNPTNSILYISSNLKSDSYEVAIKNLLGQVVYHGFHKMSELSSSGINITSFTRGTYVLQVSTADTTLNKLLIKE